MTFSFNNFISWMKNENFYISSKIDIINEIKSNYGVIAHENIKKDEILFKIPRNSILNYHNSEICDFLVSENVVENSKWGSLILCIFHEIFLLEKSRWFNYLKMFPNFDNLRLPIFWNEEEKILLNGTGIEENLRNDLELLEKDYESCVAPFIIKYQHFFNEGINLEMYKYYVAFVMSYSFTKNEMEDNESDDSECEDDMMPYMVPMADLLNHTSHNNAELIYQETDLVMIAIKPINAGEEVWNTYGLLPNTQLLQQYGFTLSIDDNNDDVIEMNFSDLPQSKCTPEIFERLEKVQQISNVVLCKDGFLNTNVLVMALHTLHLDENEYKIWIENITVDESWEETNEDLDIMSDYFDELETVVKVPLKWRSVLKDLICHTIKKKKSALNNLGSLVDGPPSPKLFVKRLLDGHLCLLENVLKYL